MNVGAYIRYLREASNLTQEQLGDKLGVKKAAVQKWESGKVVNLKREIITQLGEIFNVSPSSFIVDDGSRVLHKGLLPLPKTVKRPRLGTISCGVPIMYEENFDGYDEVPDDIKCDFTLRCSGDSMIGARINDGDIVYIKQTPVVENGSIAAVRVGEETLLKRVFAYENKIVLQAENQKYEPIVYVNEELDEVCIIGQAVAFTSTIR